MNVISMVLDGTTMPTTRVPSLYEPINGYKPVAVDIGIVDTTGRLST
jgi:hypothetical protein